jgi:hypothetical protein
MMQDCVAFTKKANWFSYVKLMGLQIISMQQESAIKEINECHLLKHLCI